MGFRRFVAQGNRVPASKSRSVSSLDSPTIAETRNPLRTGLNRFSDGVAFLCSTTTVIGFSRAQKWAANRLAGPRTPFVGTFLLRPRVAVSISQSVDILSAPLRHASEGKWQRRESPPGRPTTRQGPNIPRRLQASAAGGDRGRTLPRGPRPRPTATCGKTVKGGELVEGPNRCEQHKTSNPNGSNRGVGRLDIEQEAPVSSC